MRWWHRWALHHRQDQLQVTAPMWDLSARGILIRCECGESWAK